MLSRPRFLLGLAFALVVVGITGMVTHFWMASYAGMAWAAATVTAGILVVVSRTAWRLRASPMPARAAPPEEVIEVCRPLAAAQAAGQPLANADWFFIMAPEALRAPLVILATCATITVSLCVVDYYDIIDLPFQS